LNNHLWLPAFLVSILLASSAFGAIQSVSAQDTPILGYPYDTNGSGGLGEIGYSLYGSLFTLKGDATITSMSCKMVMAFGRPYPTPVHYRFAIYRDNAGVVGALVAQTQEGIANPTVQGTVDQWRTAAFASPVSLQAGKYWLIELSESDEVSIHSSSSFEVYGTQAEPWNQSRMVLASQLSSNNFTAFFDSLHYNDNAVISIYASGQGTPSVLPSMPPPAITGPTPSRVFLNFRNVDPSNGKFQIVGNLTSNRISVPNANITFSYRNSNESDSALQQFSTTTTDSNGCFMVDWIPPGAGSYVLNATYHGNENYGPVFDGINILVAEFSGDKQVFSVESNSTVTSIVYNSESDELNLSVMGQSGTIGFVDLYVSKSLVENVSAIQAYIDDNPVSFTVSSTEDSWILHFYYHHSSHNITFDLSGAEISSVQNRAQALYVVVSHYRQCTLQRFFFARGSGG
jgi:hypothetical protein